MPGSGQDGHYRCGQDCAGTGIAAEQERLGCGRPVLDTALDNVLAHRFYYRQSLLARALRFSRDIDR